MLSSLTPWKSKAGSNGGELTTRNGSPAFSQLRQEFDQIFNRFFGDLSVFGNHLAINQRWGVDLEEKDDMVIAKFEAPGFDMKDFELKLQGNELILKGERKTETNTKEKTEEKSASLYRSITLPQGLLTEKAEAKFHNGLLTVSFPRSEVCKGKKIAIQAV